jgi:predicted kinase
MTYLQKLELGCLSITKGGDTMKFLESFMEALQSENPRKELKKMIDDGRMAEHIPEFLECVGNDQQNPHHHLTIDEHIYKVIEGCPKDDLIARMAGFFHDIGKPKAKKWIEEKNKCTYYGHDIYSASMTEDVLTRLGFTDSHRVSALVLNHMKIHQATRFSGAFNHIYILDRESMLALMKADIDAHAVPYYTNYNRINAIYQDHLVGYYRLCSDALEEAIISNQSKKVAYMMVGVPRSGKTTIRNVIVDTLPSINVLSADDIRLALNVKFDPKIEPVVWNKHNMLLSDNIKKSKSMIIDNTHISKKARQATIKILKDNGYKVIAVELHPSYSELMRRAEESSFPKEVIMNMLSRYQSPEYEEGFDNIYRL